MVVAALAAGDGPLLWDQMTLDGQRTLLEALVTVTVLPCPKGRPAGWKPGQPYFSKEHVEITPKYKAAAG